MFFLTLTQFFAAKAYFYNNNKNKKKIDESVLEIFNVYIHRFISFQAWEPCNSHVITKIEF